MGAQGSKQVAKHAAKATAAQTSKAASEVVASAHVIQTTLRREDLSALAGAHGAKPAGDGWVDVRQGPQLPTGVATKRSVHGIKLIEMKDDLLEDMSRFDDFEKVEFLAQDTEGFEGTASSYRPRSSGPMTKPQDRTAASSTGAVTERIPGRITNSDMRELLRLHYEDPESWSEKALAKRYEVNEDVMSAILAHVGPPRVVEPRTPMEHPYGLWYDRHRIDC